MKKLTVIMLVMLIASTANAGINTPNLLGPLVLDVQPDGTGLIVNSGGVPFSFDGYTVASDTGLLGSCIGISDNTVLEMVMFPPTVGLTISQALAWTEISVTPTNYSEITFGVAATLQPGGSINLGQTMSGLHQAIGTFTYVDSGTGGSFEGEVIPEPASLALLGLGGLTLLRRRK